MEMESRSAEPARRVARSLRFLQGAAGCPILDVFCQGWDSTVVSCLGFCSSVTRSVFFSKDRTTGDNGNIYQIVNNRDTTRNQNFIYDALNRIQQAYSSGSQWGETFGPTATAPGVAPTTPGIDSWGNLTNREGVTGKTNYEPLSVSAGTNNRLSGFGYDAAGNMTSNGSATYVYDDENRLIATAGDSYIYDGDGERVEKCTEGTTPGGPSLRFLQGWDAMLPIAYSVVAPHGLHRD
jgi:hypothetical protein